MPPDVVGSLFCIHGNTSRNIGERGESKPVAPLQPLVSMLPVGDQDAGVGVPAKSTTRVTRRFSLPSLRVLPLSTWRFPASP